MLHAMFVAKDEHRATEKKLTKEFSRAEQAAKEAVDRVRSGLIEWHKKKEAAAQEALHAEAEKKRAEEAVATEAKARALARKDEEKANKEQFERRIQEKRERNRIV